MDKPLVAPESSFTARKAKGRHKKGKPSGPTTPPATPSAAPADSPPPPAKPKPLNDWSREAPEERLRVANAALREAVARFQSLGCLLYTENSSGHASIMLSGAQFNKPGSNDPTITLTGVKAQKPTLTLPNSVVARPPIP